MEGAYPRSRGATEVAVHRLDGLQGLSPLARGNPAGLLQRYSLPGPIPARAGQPNDGCAGCGAARAYPRSRGATVSALRCGRLRWGLSPLARGNRTGDRKHAIPPGPIPARAGQPLSSSRMLGASWAYPRSRGATGATRAMMDNSGGLSPLARGNHRKQQEFHALGGPIPARAGQPHRFRGVSPVRGAYPRSRGATWAMNEIHAASVGLSPLARGNHRPGERFRRD